jgi:general stress protein 26
MNNLNFSRLSGGGYSLPVLVELVHPELNSWFFTNEKDDIAWEGNPYRSVSLGYKPPGSKDGVPQGGTLELDIDIQDSEDNELLQWFDRADDRAEIKVIALINEAGEYRAIGEFIHQHGKATWDGKKITWTASGDDRFEMQPNPWTFDNDGLSG